MTEEQKVQELSKPRVKVIAPWPEMERWLARVGDILTDPGGNETVRNQNGDAVPAFEWEAFPHLFRKLEWWQFRELEDLPMYVREIQSEKVGKVFDWHNKGGEVFFTIKAYKDIYAAKWFNPAAFVPATESEYTAYITAAARINPFND